MEEWEEIEEEPDDSVGQYKQLLNQLQEVAASLSIQAKGAVLEVLEKTVTEMRALDAAVQKIREELKKAVSEIAESGTRWRSIRYIEKHSVGGNYCKGIIEPSSTGQPEMKQLKKIRKDLEALLSTSKELSSRLCAELKEIETMISNKRMEASAARSERKEERLEIKEQEKQAAEEERREWEEARRHSACT